jgi:hypothetical protein
LSNGRLSNKKELQKHAMKANAEHEKAVVKPTVVDVDELLPPLPPRPSTAEHAASVLRGQIAQGRLPGTRLPEEHVVESFAISRNTIA